MDKKSGLIICTNFCNGKKHDFKLFKDSKVRWVQNIQGIVDSAYTGIKKLQGRCLLPKKRSKDKPLTKDERRTNRHIYRNASKIWIFGCAKASGFNDHKSPHISNIRRLMIVKSRELSRCPKPNFECVSVYLLKGH